MVVIEFDRSRSMSLSALDDNDVTLSNALENQGPTSGGKACAKAVLVCRPNSHPFQERELYLDNPVKIGRSVARARPTSSNAIFDCKVLSRNHALIWYQDGKFYLQDTKSSNGTFVNNQRLSKGSEESAPREVCSGDIVQFGVDVMENTRKVTHGCIIATLKLYLPDGKEAKASMSTAVIGNGNCETLGQHDLYQLNQCIQEAFLREQVLETKLGTLQRIVQSTREAASISWNALIEEDRLLTRIETLESQLMTYSKNFGEDKSREEVRKLLEEKNVYQAVAKESLRKVLFEKMEALKKLHEVERCLNSAEEERDTVKELNDKLSQQVNEMVEQLKKESEEINGCRSKLTEAEEAQQKMADDIRQAEEKIEAARTRETQLLVQIESYQAEIDFTKQQLTNLRARMEATKEREAEENDEREGEEEKMADKTDTEVDLLKEKIVQLETELEKSTQVGKTKRDSHEFEGGAKEELQQLQELLEESRLKCANLEAEVKRAQLEAHDGWAAASQLRHLLRVLRDSFGDLNQEDSNEEDDPEQSVSLIGRCFRELKQQLADAQEDSTKKNQLIAVYSQRLEEAESELSQSQRTVDQLEDRALEAHEALLRKEALIEELNSRLYTITHQPEGGESSKPESIDEEDVALFSRPNYTSEETGNLSTESTAELLEARHQVEHLKLQCSAADEAKQQLQKQLDELKESYSLLSSQAQTVAALSFLPLMVLAISFVLAFNRFFSSLTATAEP